MVTVSEPATPSHAEIIDREGGPAAVGHRIGETPNNVKAWKRLDSIPGGYWHRLDDAGVATLAELAAAAHRRKTGEPETAAA